MKLGSCMEFFLRLADEGEIGMMPSSFPCVIGNIRLGLVFNLPSCELLYDLTQYFLRGLPKTLSSWKAIHIDLTVS